MIVLSVLLHILLGIAIFIITLFFMLLFVPFIYRSEGNLHEGQGGAFVELSWLFNAIGFRFDFVTEVGLNSELRIFFIRRILNIRPGSKNADVKTVETATKRKKKRRFTKEKLFVILRSFKRILARYKPRKLMIDAVIGFEDAYYTGLMCAGLSAVSPVLSPGRNLVRVVPEFDETVYEGCYMTEGKVVVFFVAWEALRIFFSKPFRTQK